MVVKFYHFLVLTLFLSCALLGADVQVAAEVDQNTAYENQPVKGTLTVTHDEKLKIDPNSARLNNKPLQLDFVQDVKISGTNPLTVSIYKFEVDPQPKGLQILPSISLKIGGKTYTSFPATYEVEASSQAPQLPAPTPKPSTPNPQQISTPTTGSETGYLKLEALVEGKTELYPGEQTHLIYRYTYQGNISLTKEVLPLLDAVGMDKIGEKEFKDYSEDGYNVNEISQKVEALKPGKYTYGPSDAEGYADQSNILLKSEVPPIDIIVKPFPEKGKPSSFNGAVGNFTFTVNLQGRPEARVGQEIKLSIDIRGKGNLNRLPLPVIYCQPGFSGQFKMNDLPPVGIVKNDTKHFEVPLIPLFDTIKEIPPVEFSFFDPNVEKYVTLRSNPIPIKIYQEKIETSIKEEIERKPAQIAMPKNPVKPQLIDIEGDFPLRSRDLHNLTFGSWWALAIIPLGIAALIYQLSLVEYVKKKRRQERIVTSIDLYREAMKEPSGSSFFFDRISKAFKAALFEQGKIPSPSVSLEEIPVQGISGEAAQFLKDIEEKRFSGNGKMNLEIIKTQAETLFKKLLTDEKLT